MIPRALQRAPVTRLCTRVHASHEQATREVHGECTDRCHRGTLPHSKGHVPVHRCGSRRQQIIGATS